MKLTPTKFRDAIGLTQETFRHWRRVLPIFHGRTGYAPEFTMGDLVAAAVIKKLKDTCGISIAGFAEQSTVIGGICNETPWVMLSAGSLVLSLTDNTCILMTETSDLCADELRLIVPLRPIMDQLTKVLLGKDDQIQQSIYFPPTEVNKRKRREGLT